MTGRRPPKEFLDALGLGAEHKNGKPPKLTTNVIAAAVVKGEHFAQDAGGHLYRYSGGTYKQYAARYIERRVKELLEASDRADEWSSHRASEVVEYIRADAPELWERPPLDEVNVANGILNVEARDLRPHDPAFLSPVQIPANYDPAATCPEWERFVGEVFPEDAQALAWEMAADLMTPARSAQKAVLLLGEGSNGKSTYLTALTAFVGSTNCAGVSLHKLESNQFATTRLIGKLANICPDLPSAHLSETTVFKAVTGGDRVHAEYKYGRDLFEFEPFCRLVFSANHVPRSGDASHAFFRRWLVIPFDRTFEPGESTPRAVLDARLSAPGELSGVLNKALDMLPDLRRRGFTESESMRQAWEEFKSMTDPVAVWLARNTVESVEAFVPMADLRRAYNADADAGGHNGMTAQAFGRALKRARPGIGEARLTVGGRRQMCYTGIGLLPRDGDDGPPDGDPGPPERGPGGDTCAVTAVTAVTDSTIVMNSDSSPSVQTNKTNGDSGDIPVSQDDANPVRALLADPPGWLAEELEKYRAEPERWVKPTCNSIAVEVFGSAHRWLEVKPVLEEHISVNGVNGGGPEPRRTPAR